MNGSVSGMGPTQQAELADVNRKRYDTLRARCALLGLQARREGDRIHVGRLTFEDLEKAEDWLDNVVEG